MKMLNIYVANLAAYNAGRLVGDWLSLPATDEEIDEMLIEIGVAYKTEGGEVIVEGETAIHDYECDFGMRVSEWDSIENLNELAEDIETAGGDPEIVEAIYQVTLDIDEAVEIYKKGDYEVVEKIKNKTDLGVWIVENGYFGEVPYYIAKYLDYEAIGDDAITDDAWVLTSDKAIRVN